MLNHHAQCNGVLINFELMPASFVWNLYCQDAYHKLSAHYLFVHACLYCVSFCPINYSVDYFLNMQISILKIVVGRCLMLIGMLTV